MSQCIAAALSGPTGFSSYIGLRDTVGDDKLSSHKWTADNTTMSYNNFNPSEPGSTEEYCVSMDTSSGFQWFDTPCHEAIKGLCEINLVSQHNFEFTCDTGLKELYEANPINECKRPKMS